MKLGKMNEKLEVSLAMGRWELNEGLRAIAKMLKGLSLDSTVMTGEGSGVRSTATFEKQIAPEPMVPKQLAAATGEGNYRKLELSLFKGVDLNSWIFQAERYFGMNKFTDAERGVCMEGSALSWFQ